MHKLIDMDAHSTEELFFKPGGAAAGHVKTSVMPGYHPLRQLWRDLLSNQLSVTSAILLTSFLLLVFVGTRLAFRFGFWAMDRLRECGRPRDRVVFAPFQDRGFWEREYGEKPKPFEWYATFKDLRPILEGVLAKRDRVLHVGCGTSTIAVDLWHEFGIREITNIDVSERALELATAQAARDRRGPAEMEFRLADIRNLEHESWCPEAAFDVALDKGTLDSISCDTSEGEANVAASLRQLRRALRPGGLLIVVTTVDAADVQRWFDTAGFERVSVTHLVTKMSRRRVPVMPNDVWLLRAPENAALRVGGAGGSAKTS